MNLRHPLVASLALVAGLGFGAAHAVPTSASTIVNLDATKGKGSFASEVDAAPVTITLAAGNYNLAVIDNTARGGYNGYNYNTGPTIREAFDFSINGGPVFAVDKTTNGFSSYASASAAIAAFATGPYAVYNYTPGSGATSLAYSAPTFGFTLTAPATLTFAIPDNLFGDNRGGVSLEITAAVPEPETYALMLAGLGAMIFISRRRKA